MTVHTTPESEESLPFSVGTNDARPASNASKRRKTNAPTNDGDDSDNENLKEKIVTIWKDVDSSTQLEEAIVSTKEIVTQQVQGIIRMGLDAYHRAESLSTKIDLLSDEIKQKNVEIERLRAADETNASSIANLNHALEQSRSQTQDAAHSILVEARLRAQISTTNAQRDEAIGQSEENKHKVTLLQEQLSNEKVKLSRVTRDKLKVERDFMVSQRATQSLVQSMEQQSTAASDTEYYKRKIAELTGRLQSSNVVVAEKNRQIEEMRHQLERNMSQSKWAAATTSKRG